MAGSGDATARADAERLFDEAQSALGGLDGVVDIVGMARYANLVELTDEDWNWHFDICLRHAYLAMQLGGRALSAGGGGAMVFVASVSGITSAPRHSAYGAAKAGLMSLVRSGAVELGPAKVRVNAVAPGVVWTPRVSPHSSATRGGSATSRTHRCAGSRSRPTSPPRSCSSPPTSRRTCPARHSSSTGASGRSSRTRWVISDMFVQVDLATVPPTVSLEEPDDCKRFHLAVVGGRDAAMVFGALVDAAAGRLEGDHAWITVDAVRRMAAGRVGPDWASDFEGMLAFAAVQGLDRPERCGDPGPRRVGRGEATPGDGHRRAVRRPGGAARRVRVVLRQGVAPGTGACCGAPRLRRRSLARARRARRARPRARRADVARRPRRAGRGVRAPPGAGAARRSAGRGADPRAPRRVSRRRR